MPLVLVRLLSDGSRLLVEVWDQAPGVPFVRPPSADAESGRGLLLVKSIAFDWGWRNVPAGKCVWGRTARLAPAQARQHPAGHG